MTPGEVIPAAGEIELNAGAPVLTLDVTNAGDRPVQVGSHCHFAQTNRALRFDRDAARGHRLDIPAGTAMRFEPGQARRVRLIPFCGAVPAERAAAGNAADDAAGAPGTTARRPDAEGGASACSRQAPDAGQR